MADSVSAGETGGTYYTWDGVGATAAWDSATGSTHTWIRSRSAAITVDVAVAMNFAETAPYFSIGFKPVEIFAFAERVSKGSSIPLSETFGLDGPSPVWKRVADTWASAGYDWRGTIGLTLSVGYTRSIAESLGIGEDDGFAIGKNQSETVNIAEAGNRNYIKPVSEAWATAESYISSNGFNLSFVEGWSVAEALRNGIAGNYAENWTQVESHDDVAAFDRRLAEALNTSESLTKSVSQALVEAFATAEAYSDVAAFTCAFSEAWSTAESYSDVADFTRTFAENWATAEGYSDVAGFTRAIAESFAMLEANGIGATKAVAEFVGASRGAIQFNSAASNYATISDTTFGKFASSFTVMARVKTTETIGQRCIMSVTGDAGGWRFGYDGGRPYWLAGQTGGTNYAEGPIGSTTLNDGVEHHLAIIFKLGVSVTAVIDGVQVGSVAITAANTNNGGSLVIGTMHPGAGFINAIVDDCEIYLGELTIPQIAGIANRSAPGVSGLIGRWGFDEQSGSTIYDTSGFGRHGTIISGTRVALTENANGVTHPESEAFSTTEASVTGVAKGVAEAIATVESYSDVASFDRGFNEAVGVNEALVNGFLQALAEAWSTAEAHDDVAGFDRQFAEAMATTDAIRQQAAKPFSEALTLVETPSNTAGKSVAESFATTDAAVKTIANAIAELFALAEQQTGQVGMNKSEVVGVAEQIDDVAGFDRQIAEVLSVLGGGYYWNNAPLTWAEGTNETWNGPAALAKDVTTPKAESVALADQYSDVAGFTRTFAETFTANDTLARGIAQAISELLTTTDGMAGSIGFIRDFAELLAVAEADSRASSVNLAETFAAVETYATVNAFSRSFAESLVTSEAFVNALGKSLAESFATAEAHSDVIAFDRQFAEAIGTAEALAKVVQQALVETVNVAEQHDDVADFARSFAENLNTTEAMTKVVAQAINEALAVVELGRRDYAKALTESAAFAESLGRTTTFSRAIAEGLTVAEAVRKAVTLPRAEQFALGDQIRRNAAGVVSDVLFKNGDISLADFNALLVQAQPTGYGPFTHFMEGDQEYKNAIFKAILTATDAARPRITNLAVTVDVPDLRDSGRTDVLPGGTYVAFNRVFYTPPEVRASLRGGTTFAIPRVTDITEAGFMVELFDRDDISVAGSVTWAATGF